MKTSKTIGCSFVVLLSLIDLFVQVNSQICSSTLPYSRCSNNTACGCIHLADADDIGVCGLINTVCSEFVPCGPSHTCSNPGHVCLNHYRCHDSPVCYPLSMTEINICPPMSPKIKSKKWKQNATTVAGGKRFGSGLDRILKPYGISVDQDKNILVVDVGRAVVMQWKANDTQGKIVAGRGEPGSAIDELYFPTDLIVNPQDNSLIIADRNNRRIVRWFNPYQQEILIENISSYGLAMDKYGFLYVSNFVTDEVKRWKIGEIKGKEGVIVAGGYGAGNQLNQLNMPSSIFVDNEQSVYIADLNNNRVTKWRKNATEGVVVAGGNGKGSSLNQLNSPEGLFVDNKNQIYVVDTGNDRIMRWTEGDKQGEVIVGGNGMGQKPDQLCKPVDMTFDSDGNLYVSDGINCRVQKFDLISQ